MSPSQQNRLHHEEHITTSVPQSQPHRPYQRKRTVKKEFCTSEPTRPALPKRGHPKRDQNRASESAKPTLSKKRTTKTKSAPRGQQHRLHLKRGQLTSTETSLEVTTNDLTNEGTQKGSRMKPKEENLKTEGQKAKPMQNPRKKPHHIAICLGHMRQNHQKPQVPPSVSQ